MQRIETKILENLIQNEDYCRKVLPFIKDEYFTDNADRIVFKEIQNFVEKYNSLPTADALEISIQNNDSIREGEFKEVTELLGSFSSEKENFEWLLNETEKYCKDKAVFNSIMRSIQIIEGKDAQLSRDGIPSLLQEALSVCFDNNVGHDYFDSVDTRYDFYHRVEERIPFDIDLLNKITKGGLPRKTLNIALAGTGVGKSLFMCHVAASVLLQGKNVLYITMEMAEERIAERIDANLMNIEVDQLPVLSKQMFDQKIQKLKDKTTGKLIIKEYPTASAHVGHFKALLNELKLKRDFVPDIIFVDYLNICASARFKAGSNINSYTLIKAIAEEMRGMAVEFDVPIVSATQTTRSGYGNTDVELTDTSESFGLPATADFMFALISTEELEKLNQIMVKQLKNRYNDPTAYKRFVVGIDRAKMKLYNVEMSAQEDISDRGFEIKQVREEKPQLGNRKPQRDFSGLKV